VLRRNKQQTIIEILKNIYYSPKGLKPTHIMYKTNINCAILKNILAELEAKAYITRNPVCSRGIVPKSCLKRYVYVSTSKTVELLHAYAVFEGSFNEIVLTYMT
jgi:predicted transcriptional regulator